jgi:hypothetical protein
MNFGFDESRNIRLKDFNISKFVSYIESNYICHEQVIRKFNLVISLYDEKNIERQEEYLTCLGLNRKNSFIDKIIVFYEGIKNDLFFKLKMMCDNIIIVANRFSYDDLFNYCNDNMGDYIFCNSDIILTNTFMKLQDIDLTNKIISLTRWEIINEEEIQVKLLNKFIYEESQDTMVFKSPIYVNCDVCPGILGCENMINGEFKKNEYDLFNPCIDLITIHLHNTMVRNYENDDKSVEKCVSKFCYLFELDEI